VIPNAFVQDLLTRVDIVDVVGSRVQLKKQGLNYWACCPFHSEKTPRFSVSPDKQFYHCFGCGQTGSAISFLMAYSGLSFVEAVEELARSVGLQVPHEGPSIPKEERQRKQAQQLALSDVMSRADSYYRSMLKISPEAIEYLRGRGLSGQIAARFGLGYVPDSWSPLKQCFDNYEAPELVEAGLVIEREVENRGGSARRYDRFRARIMFPIRNERGQVIAFGGRVLGKGEPKYLNSPETPLFSKGNELYGLFEARAAIREAGYVLVVEGYMDVVALSQLGFPQAVATLGTACTEMHVRKLFRYTNKVVFSFDGDMAGRKAAKRAMESSLSAVNDERQVLFLFLPPEHDPDSFIREKGAEAFGRMVASAEPLSQFLMGEITGGLDMATMEGRSQALNRARPWVSVMKKSALRTQIVRKLIELVGMPEKEVLPWLGFAAPGLGANKKGKGFGFGMFPRQPGHMPARTARPPAPKLDRQVLRVLIRYPALMATVSDGQREMLLGGTSENRSLLAALVGLIDQLGSGDPAKVQYAALVEMLRNAGFDIEQLVAETSDDAISDESMAAVQLKGALGKMRMGQIDAEMSRLAKTVLTNVEDQEKYRELSKELMQLREAEKAENERVWEKADII
jgi:DNA primase